MCTGVTKFLQLPQYHIPSWLDGVNAAIQSNATGVYLDLIKDTDYFVDINRGFVVFVPSIAAGVTIRAWFSFYTGLVGEAARYVNGVPNSESIQGWRNLGQSVEIRGPATVITPTVAATLIFDEGYDGQFGRELAATLVLTYLNALDIGEPARYAVIGGILTKTPGVKYVENFLLNSGVVDVPPTHEYGVVRGDASLITV